MLTIFITSNVQRKKIIDKNTKISITLLPHSNPNPCKLICKIYSFYFGFYWKTNWYFFIQYVNYFTVYLFLNQNTLSNAFEFEIHVLMKNKNFVITQRAKLIYLHSVKRISCMYLQIVLKFKFKSKIGMCHRLQIIGVSIYQYA